ncbi:MAG: zf-HC2 domain-containing protein [Myxococcales bacterium]|nr:zf-HC2 domain-containing protein [Myxococcales bacterium]
MRPAMDCAAIRRYLDLLIDDELDPRDRLDADAHMDACAACRALVRREEELRQLLRSRLDVPAAPARLRGAILAALDAEVQSSRPSLWDRFIEFGAPALLTAAIATVIVWPFGAPVSADAQSPVTTAGPVASRSIATETSASAGSVASSSEVALASHATPVNRPAISVPRPVVGVASDRRSITMASLRSLPVDVPGSETEIQAYLGTEVPFEIRSSLPDVSGVQLLGARVVEVDGRTGVLLAYEVEGRRVAAIQTMATSDDKDSPELVVAREGVASTGRFVRDDILHTVIADLDPAALARLLGP